MVRRRPAGKRRFLGMEPKELAAVVIAVIGYWDARTHPDQKAAANASLSASVAETQAAFAESLTVLRRRMGRLEHRLARGAESKQLQGGEDAPRVQHKSPLAGLWSLITGRP